MITPEQATDLRLFLREELISNGFGNIVYEVDTRLEEDYQEESFDRTPQYLLDFFLSESIEVLENLSNKNFDGLIARLNKFTMGKSKIEGIQVELLNDGKPVYYDLRNLPNYSNISSVFREILIEIRKQE